MHDGKIYQSTDYREILSIHHIIRKAKTIYNTEDIKSIIPIQTGVLK